MRIVPHLAPDGSHHVWVAGDFARAPRELRLRWRSRLHGSGTWTLTANWTRHDTHPSRYICKLALPRLAAGDTYEVGSEADGSSTEVTIPVVPSELPRRNDPMALRVALSSCFYQGTDAGKLERSIAGMGKSLAPHIKFLSGDQVYGDIPVSQNLSCEREALRAQIAAKYWRNFGTPTTQGALSAYLGWGANVFVSDDHEFWNNYPLATPIASNTWREADRATWAQVARELFFEFQTLHPARPSKVAPHCFRLGRASPLEFFALDGRLFRTRTTAHADSHMTSFEQWVGQLRGPGAVVLSQPLFEPQVPWIKRKTADANIQDFDDYPRIARALWNSKHDIVVLSGDIHGGRTAFGRAANALIYEVVSSPTSLVSPSKRSPKPAFERFPAHAIPGVPGGLARTEVTETEDHIALLSFSSLGSGVHLRVDHWRLGDPPRISCSSEVTLR